MVSRDLRMFRDSGSFPFQGFRDLGLRNLCGILGLGVEGGFRTRMGC